MGTPGLSSYLIVSAGLFCVGVYGVVTRRSLLGILIGIELMLAAASLDLLAFGRFAEAARPGALAAGQAFSVLTLVVGAVQAILGVGIIVSVYRRTGAVRADEMDSLRW